MLSEIRWFPYFMGTSRYTVHAYSNDDDDEEEEEEEENEIKKTVNLKDKNVVSRVIMVTKLYFRQSYTSIIIF